MSQVPEVFQEYIEQGPRNEQAQWVVGAIRSELGLRRQVHTDTIISLNQQLQLIEKEVSVIDAALEPRRPITETESPDTSEILREYAELRQLTPGELQKRLADYPPFDIRLMMSEEDNRSWAEANGPMLEDLFGHSYKRQFCRTVNGLTRIARQIPELEQDGIVSGTQIQNYSYGERAFTRNCERVAAFTIEIPAAFMNFGIDRIKNFGAQTMPTVIAISRLQSQQTTIN